MDIDEVMITNKDELDARHIAIHQPYEYYKYEIVKKSDGNQCCAALYEIPPGKSNYPYHYHAKSEEIFYIISGSGILEIPSGLRAVKAGDIIVCPPSENGATDSPTHPRRNCLRIWTSTPSVFLRCVFIRIQNRWAYLQTASRTVFSRKTPKSAITKVNKKPHKDSGGTF